MKKKEERCHNRHEEGGRKMKELEKLEELVYEDTICEQFMDCSQCPLVKSEELCIAEIEGLIRAFSHNFFNLHAITDMREEVERWKKERKNKRKKGRKGG